jgi:hypothetical protein
MLSPEYIRPQPSVDLFVSLQPVFSQTDDLAFTSGHGGFDFASPCPWQSSIVLVGSVPVTIWRESCGMLWRWMPR